MSHVTVKQTQIPAADLPPAVVSSTAEEGSEAEGTLEPVSPAGIRWAVLTYHLKGNTTLKVPKGVPATGASTVLVRIFRTGHTLKTEGITWNGGEPAEWPEKALVTLFTPDGGTTWEATGPEKGAQGAPGAEGPEAAGGVAPLRLTETAPTYKTTGSTEAENLPVVAETIDRSQINNHLLLTSGTPLGALVIVPAKTVIHGAGPYIEKLDEETPTRTHLWVALLNSKLEVLRLSADYTSIVNTPMIANTAHCLKFATSYETGATRERLYVVICEVMSVGKPLTVYASNSTNSALAALTPRLTFLGETGRTTPESLASTVVPSASTASTVGMVLV